MPSKVSPPKPASLTFQAIGTQWRISAAKTIDKTTRRCIQERIARFDQTYSRFKPNSWLRQIGSQAGIYDLPADAEKLFDVYQKLYDITNGAMTPLIGQTLSQAGYDEKYSLQATTLTQLPGWDEALTYNFPKLTIKQPVLLDVGAAGKGYLVDSVCELLNDAKYDDFVVDAGGDMRAVGQPVRIGLENPFDTTEIIGMAELISSSLCGSAGNRRAWPGFTHIINPHTLSSETPIAAVWVVASSGLLADALSTALFFTSPAKLAATYDFEYAIVSASGELQYSAKFPARFFSN